MVFVIAGIAHRLPDTQTPTKETQSRVGTAHCNRVQLVRTDHDHGCRHKQISHTPLHAALSARIIRRTGLFSFV
jgi:hypothetical protein